MDLDKFVGLPLGLTLLFVFGLVMWRVVIPGAKKIVIGFAERYDAEREKRDKLQDATILRLERREEEYTKKIREDRDLFLAALDKRDVIMERGFAETIAAIKTLKGSPGRARE